MTDTERLVAFLLDRETERGIAAGEIHNKYSCASIGAVGVACDCGEPERVIAESAARRRIITKIAPIVDHYDREIAREWGSSKEGTADLMLRILVQPFRAHPDFDPVWAVDQS